MPILNHDILLDIFIESTKTGTSRSLSNFMMAGKETFKIALNHFSHAKRVSVQNQRCGISIKLAGPYGKFKYEPISHDFVLLKPILAVVSSSVEEIVIDGNSRLIEKHKVLRYLLQNCPKKLKINRILPKYLRSLLNQFQVESVGVCLNRIGVIRLPFAIPQSCDRLHLYGIFLEEFLHQVCDNPTKLLFPYVKELVIDARVDGLGFKTWKLGELFTFISQNFPSLESMIVTLSLNRCYWSTIKTTVLYLQPNGFNKLTLNVKGKICVDAKQVYCHFDKVLIDTHEKNYIKTDREFQHIEKKFEIDNGLSFAASFCFIDDY